MNPVKTRDRLHRALEMIRDGSTRGEIEHYLVQTGLASNVDDLESAEELEALSEIMQRVRDERLACRLAGNTERGEKLWTVWYYLS